MAYQGPFPTASPCRMPCKHCHYVDAVRKLMTQKRYEEAKQIVERNSAGRSPTPHDWQADLTMKERMRLRNTAEEATIF